MSSFPKQGHLHMTQAVASLFAFLSKMKCLSKALIALFAAGLAYGCAAQAPVRVQISQLMQSPSVYRNMTVVVEGYPKDVRERKITFRGTEMHFDLFRLCPDPDASKGCIPVGLKKGKLQQTVEGPLRIRGRVLGKADAPPSLLADFSVSANTCAPKDEGCFIIYGGDEEPTQIR